MKTRLKVKSSTLKGKTKTGTRTARRKVKDGCRSLTSLNECLNKLEREMARLGVKLTAHVALSKKRRTPRRPRRGRS